MSGTRIITFEGPAVEYRGAESQAGRKLDVTKPLTLTGTVTQIDWANPYVHILMKVSGRPLPVLWAVEVESPIVVTDNAWSESLLPVGETIRVGGYAARPA